jgi:AraC family transcriptional regulator, ethanolamine operon transcriptional activator
VEDTAQQRFIVHHRFDDVDEFAESVRGWNLDVRKLDRNRFGCEILQVGIGGVRITRSRFNSHLEIKGSAPEGYRSFGMLTQNSTPAIWCARSTSDQTMAVYDARGDFESVVHPGFESVIFSMDDNQTSNALDRASSPGLRERLQSRRMYRGNPGPLFKARLGLIGFCQYLRQTPDSLGNTDLFAGFLDDISDQLLSILGSTVEVSTSVSSQRRDVLLRRAKSFILENTDEPISVNRLCQYLSTNERTLRRVFLDRFGVSPKSYLQAHRLNGARKDLRLKDPATTKVSDIANDWGFWHMGQFASDYRRLFNELPSATLQQTTRPIRSMVTVP